MTYFLQQLPFVTISAVLGLAALLLLVVPSIRRKVSPVFSSTHVHEIPLLDTLRGFAALFVMMFHTWQWLQPFNDSARSLLPFIVQGNKGVPIFASLSGLVIYMGLKDRINTIDDLRIYLLRRIYRIYPLFIVTQ